jgi:hypothetical protein
MIQLDLDNKIALVHSNITNTDVRFGLRKLTEDFNISYFIDRFESFEMGEEIMDINVESAESIYSKDVEVLKDCKSFNLSIHNNKDREIKIDQPINGNLYTVLIIKQ